MRRLPLIVSLFVLVCVFVQSTGILFAQESETVPTVIPQQDNTLKIEQLQNTYFSQLEEYRNQEQAYIVARNQYLQLNTLASQELAVNETRNLLSLRADVFITYLDILKEMLIAAKGIPLENKNPEIITIGLLSDQVKVHKTKVESAQDRFAVDQESVSFEPTVTQLESHTYYILSLIKMGNMQEAYDKLLVVRQATKTFVENQPLTNSQKSEKARGFAEIDRTVSSTDSVFTPLKVRLYGSPGQGSVGSYSELSTSLTPVYAQINQVIQFLEEIRK